MIEIKSYMSFQAIYNQHFEQIYKFCYRFLNCGETAMDITQETFIKIYQRMQSNGPQIENNSAWLYKVAGNLCLNAIATGHRQSEIIKSMPAPSTEIKNPETVFIENETKEHVHKAIQQFEPKQQMLILMYQDGLSYKEMAEATGISLNSVGKTLWRTIEKLAEMIKKQDNE